MLGGNSLSRTALSITEGLESPCLFPACAALGEVQLRPVAQGRATVLSVFVLPAAATVYAPTCQVPAFSASVLPGCSAPGMAKGNPGSGESCGIALNTLHPPLI